MAGNSAPSKKGPWQRELEAHCEEHGLREPIYLPVTQGISKETGPIEHGCRVYVGDDIFSSRAWHTTSNVDDAEEEAREDVAEEAVLYYKTTIERKYTNLLCERLKAGDHRGVEQSIHSGANVNGLFYPAEGHSPLLIAIGRRDTTAIRILLAAGADINYGATLRAALCTRDANTVFTLLINGVDVHGDGVLAAAAEYGDPKVLRMLVQGGIDVNAPQGSDGSALIIAILRGHIDFIKTLLDSGARTNMQCADCRYQTALMAAIGAPAGTHDGNGLTNERKTQMINILVERGADINLQLTDSSHGNPLDAAVNTGDEQIIRTVLAAGADFANVSAGGTLTCQWELPRIFADEDGKLDIYSVPTMTQKHESVLLSTCAQYLKMTYGKRSIRILEGIVCALKDPDGLYAKDGIILRATSLELSVTVNSSMTHLLNAVIWLCLTFREPPPDGPQVSTGALDKKTFRFSPWRRFKSLTSRDTTCWSALFDSAVVVLEPWTSSIWGWMLELSFESLIQLAAVEYPVFVDNGIVLMGYSTALTPVGKTDNRTIVWHLEVAPHDSQLNISELTVTKWSWLRTKDIEELRSDRHLLGWCGNASVALGTMHATPTIKRSDASTKHTSWQWTGANLQLVAQSGGPAQVGGQLGFTFCRKMMAVHFSASDNYLKCLRNSVSEQIIVYDTTQQRAWLIPLVCMLHQMLLSYAKDHGLASGMPQATSGNNNGGLASLEALKSNALSVIDRSSGLELTVRDLIMGFSVNMSKTAVQKPSGRKIYGYEFWDIIEDSTHCELKQRQLERQGLAWAPLLGEIKCLFCSNFGDAIIGNRAASAQSPCNRVPARKDLMAASTCSLNALLERHGASLRVPNRSGILAGTPFQQCSHQGQKDTCWESPNFLQDIRVSNPDSQKAIIKADTYPNGAVVFGRSGNRFADMVQRVNIVIRK